MVSEVKSECVRIILPDDSVKFGLLQPKTIVLRSSNDSIEDKVVREVLEAFQQYTLNLDARRFKAICKRLKVEFKIGT